MADANDMLQSSPTISHIAQRLQERRRRPRIPFNVTSVVNVSPQGMGPEFLDIQPKDRAILEKWLADEQARRES